MNLDNLMTNEKITLTELGTATNIDPKTISNYRKQIGLKTIHNFINIANYFNVSLDYLCDRPFNNQIGYIPEDRRELVKMIIDLDASDIRAVTSYINGYLAGKSGNSNFKVFN